MFTGLIEEIGIVKSITRGRNSARITVLANRILIGSKLGDSIAVNGVCLTIDEMNSDSFSSDMMFTTMEKTNLGKLTSGGKVNLERAMALGERLGGHLVSGHIDCTGTILNKRESDIAIVLEILPPVEYMPYIVSQGSVALDGVSLTVAKKEEKSFSVSLIPHTAKETIIAAKKSGDSLNIETDIIGKYIESLILKNKINKGSKIDTAFLAEHGFLS